jgi:hypothetical protein
VSIRTAIPTEESGQWDAPAHFTFQGNTYFYRGGTVYFRWSTWETADGPEPFLRFAIE